MKYGFIFASALLGICAAFSATAATQNSASLSSADFTLQPPVLTARETPMVMLGLSVDNQLFYKAYTDYTDIDSDGALDITYKDDFDYYGYFQTGWCYSYNTTDRVFEPSSESTGANGHYCSGDWSGNFLNWATMTRVDVLRRVLFGGKRSTDTADSTILERAYVPSDVHAFAKVYSGSDIASLTPYTAAKLKDDTLTLCNVSSSYPYSSTSLPQLRLAKGNYRRWSINEVYQCQWGQGDNRPDSADRLNKDSENIVRVKACVAGKDASSEDCKTYNTGKAKPIGLLQQYGEEGDLKFGLISGSYRNYVAGGVLRKNIGLFGSNSNSDDDEINLENGVFNDVDGIISTIDTIHITGWSGSGYDCGGAGISISDFKNGTKACRDWGNPISEIYAEAVRYFAGATSATTAFKLGTDSDGNTKSDTIAALSEASWPTSLSVNPLNVDTRCAACSIIMISSGVSSFDGDDLSSVSDIEGISSVSDLESKTTNVGKQEYGASSLNVLIGDNGGSNAGDDDLLCSSKSLSGLGSALGICPEAPALEGSYQIVGLANHAKTTDLRTDAGMEGEQTVDTFGVELSETVPSFRIPVGSGEIQFLPACQSQDGNDGDWIPCSLFDVEVLDLEKNSDGDPVSGTLMFHWEDSSWGSDYDLDGSQVISFCVGGSSSTTCDNGATDSRAGADYDVPVTTGQLRISQGVAYTAAGFNLRFGYVVTGSSSDGAPGKSGGHQWLVRPGDQNRNDLCQLSNDGSDGNPYMPLPSSADGGCGTADGPESSKKYKYYPESHKFTASTSGNGGILLDKPLLLAAKYGGFIDRDSSGDPTYQGSTTDTREWDQTNNRTGASGAGSADGIPDNYFFSSNPGLLVGQLQRIFESLVARTASGTNAAVVANTSSGIGAVYQALYQPQFSVGSNTVTWTGTLRAIFIDDNGNLREDSNQNQQLDSYSVDKRVEFEFDPSVDKTFVQRYVPDSANPGQFLTDGAPVELNQLKPIWSAVDRLAAMMHPEEQRASYATIDNDRRYILTAMDRNSDGEVDEQDVVAFDDTAMSSAYSNYYEYFGLSGTGAPAAASVLIDYLRGKEFDGLRNRTIDYDNDGSSEVWRLGDIIHSTPAVVATPDGNYNRQYSDTTYEDFVDQYLNRRQMVYVGANDGMIHAFNGGFWDAGSRAFLTNPGTGVATPALGQEMWAYVPSNLLPHMRWLPEQNYQHVYFVDGEPLTFDANVFADDATHPEGWGTILIVGMRFGGSPIELQVDGKSEVMQSAYVAFDVTDPEQAPKLLGEITRPELGFTLSKPVVVKNRQPSATGDWTAPSINEWYLVLGSGPRGTTALQNADSDQTAKLFAVDLKQLVANAGNSSSSASYFTTISGNEVEDLGGNNGFVGGLSVADWDRNNSDDAVYFGTVELSGVNSTGRLHRLLIEDNDGTTVSNYGIASAPRDVILNAGRPIQAEPETVRDNLGERWVLFGTGKLLVPTDNSITDQEYFFGIKEPRNLSTGELNYSAVDPNDLIDVTDVGVFEEDGVVKDLSSGSKAQLSISGTDVDDFYALESIIQDYPGWVRRMQKPAGAPSGRVVGKATLNPASRESFAFTEYVPPAESCELDGESFLYGLSIVTGTATPDAPLGTTDDYVDNSKELSLSVVSLGQGLSSSATFHQSGEGGLKALTNSSTGEIKGTSIGVAKPASGRQSWRQIESISF